MTFVPDRRPVGYKGHLSLHQGVIRRWQYLIWTISNTSPLFQPLEDAIHQQFIPPLTGQEPCSPEERRLLSLPVRLGGLNILNPGTIADRELNASEMISAPLKEMIINQTDTSTMPDLHHTKLQVQQQKRYLEDTAQEVKEQLPEPLCRATDLASEKGSSTLLTALPLHQQARIS